MVGQSHYAPYNVGYFVLWENIFKTTQTAKKFTLKASATANNGLQGVRYILCCGVIVKLVVAITLGEWFYITIHAPSVRFISCEEQRSTCMPFGGEKVVLLASYKLYMVVTAEILCMISPAVFVHTSAAYA